MRRPWTDDGRWEVDDEQLDGEDYAATSRLVRHAFGQRRKQLGTSPAGIGYTRTQVQEALAAAGLPAAARPEELQPGAWVRFARVLGALPPAAGAEAPGAEAPGGRA